MHSGADEVARCAGTLLRDIVLAFFPQFETPLRRRISIMMPASALIRLRIEEGVRGWATVEDFGRSGLVNTLKE